MALNSKQRRELMARAHHLKPVVRIGQKGLTPAVVTEADGALAAHELIKAHVQLDERSARRRLAAKLAAATGAELVDGIGKVFILYRRRQECT